MSVSFPNFNQPVPTAAGSGVERPTTVTVDTGVSAGNVFDGQGNDFLDPNNIGGTVTDFSKSIRPVSSNTLTAQLVGSSFFGRHPDATAILRGTNGLIGSINSPTFGAGLIITPPVITGPGGQLIPDFGANPDPTKVTLFTNFFTQNVQSPGSVFNPNNQNPILWQNPSAVNILLGSMNAGNTVLNGGNIFTQPPPAINPFNPFGGVAAIPVAQPVPVAVPVPVIPVARPTPVPTFQAIPVFRPPIPTPIPTPFPSHPASPPQADASGVMLTLMNHLTSTMNSLLHLVNTGGNAGTAGSTYPQGYP